MKKLYFLSLTLFFIIITSCSSEPKRALSTTVSNFIDSNDKVSAYGYFNFLAIKGKAHLSLVPTIGEFVNNQIEAIENAVELTDKVYYAAEGPFDQKGIPRFSYLFMSVKNQDSLKASFSQMGFYFEEENGVMISSDLGLAIAYDEHTLTLVYNDINENSKDKLLSAISSYDKKIKSNKTKEVLSQTTDLLCIGKMDNLYKLASANNLKMNSVAKKSLRKITKNAQVILNLDFENGELNGTLNYSDLSENTDRQLFNEELNTEMLDYLSSENPIAAMVTSLNIENINDLFEIIVSSESQFKNIAKNPYLKMLLPLAEGDMSNLLNGDVGVVMSYSDSNDVMGFANIPNNNVYLGLGDNPQNFRELLETYAVENTELKLEEDLFLLESGLLMIEDEALVFQSGITEKAELKLNQSIELEEMESLGKEPFSLFLNLKHYSKSRFDSPRNSQEQLLFLTDFAKIQANNEALNFSISLKNREDNVLRQVVQVYEEVLKKNMKNRVSIGF